MSLHRPASPSASTIRPNEHLLDIYRVKEHMEERVGYVRLDRNERVTPLSDNVFHDILGTLEAAELCAYPDPSPLLAGLSRYTGLPQESLYVTPGSDGAIRMVLQTFLRPNDTIVITDPTYAMYDIYAQILGATAVKVSYDEQLTLDVGQLYALLQTGPRVLALPNPDQPSGTVLPQAVVRDLAARAQHTHTLLIVDEAYFPYWPETALELAAEFDNVVVIRTLSKAFGLAGLRVGFFAAHPRIVDFVERVRGAHEVNALAVAIGSYVLEHPELVQQHLDEVEAGKAVLRQAATKYRLSFPACHTNFQLLGIPGRDDTSGIVNALRGEGYLVKGGFGQAGFRDKIRVSLGPPDVMQGFVEALERVLS